MHSLYGVSLLNCQVLYIGEMIVMHVECNDEADLSSFIIKTLHFIFTSSSITQLFQSNVLNK